MVQKCVDLEMCNPKHLDMWKSDNSRTIGFVAVMSAVGMFVSCSADRPGVRHLEVGEKGSAEAFVGQELPVRAEIALGEKIATIHLDAKASEAGGWTFHRHYTEGYAGKDRAAFAEKIDIPEDAKVGGYTVTVKAIGESGAAEEKSADFRLSVDSSVPVTGDLDVGINAAGNDLHLETDITAAKKIKQVRVEIKGAAWSRDFTFDKAQMKDQLSYNFHEHVPVDEAPAGEYEVLLTVEDQDGRTAVAHGSFEKK